MVVSNDNRDPLERARQQLDFAAIAAVAPSSRQILYKAQTLAPLSVARPWWKVSKWTIAAAVVCTLAFVPWLPVNTGYTMLKVSFEQPFDRPTAQDLVLSFVREMPDYALLSADYGLATDGTERPGQLVIHVNAVNRAPEEMKQRVDSIISQYAATAQPYMTLTGQINVRRFRSPYMMSMEALDARDDPRRKISDPVAREVLDSEPVFAKGAGAQLNQLGYTLTDFGFLDSKTITGDLAYDFEVGCWPRPVGVSVEHYADLTDHEQQQIRECVVSFLAAASLVDSGILLTTDPQPWLPVIIDVVDVFGNRDQRLTAKVQAELLQPSEAELKSIDFDIDSRVQEALVAVMANREYLTDYEQVYSPQPTGPQYRVTVSITGIRQPLHPWVKR